jgi:hypothetical protein
MRRLGLLVAFAASAAVLAAGATSHNEIDNQAD